MLAPSTGRTIWLTGLPSSGKSTLAAAVAAALTTPAEVLDGDMLRNRFFPELTFSWSDRTENIRRTGRLATMLARHGVTVLVSVIAPSSEAREWVRQLHADARIRYDEVWVDAPAAVCERRDVKGLYARARRQEITGVTGFDDPYEPPHDPSLHLETAVLTVDECVARIMGLVRDPVPAMRDEVAR
ncbi:adenylyl-sulfate kinase [Nocardia sp. NPDC052566]|uniref:adenylyl-sulfate kinase n=1 Tax=Nocardia sp. NPDC052566 TaxID=3364330 RepID=UPI0037C8600B